MSKRGTRIEKMEKMEVSVFIYDLMWYMVTHILRTLFGVCTLWVTALYQLVR